MVYGNKQLYGKPKKQESVLSSRQQVQESSNSGISSRIQIREQLAEQKNQHVIREPVSNAKRLQKPEHNDDYIGGFTNTVRNSTYHKSRSLDTSSRFGSIGQSVSQDDDLDYL